MSDMVSELLNFFEQREGQHVSDVDIEAVMQKAVVRIEQLEEENKRLRKIVEEAANYFMAAEEVRDKLGEEL